MYKMNSVRLLDESEIIGQRAERLEECINKLRTLESKLPAMNSDTELISLTTRIIGKLEQQQQTIRKFSYVVSAASNTVTAGNRQSVSVCSHETELRDNLVSNMLSSNNSSIDPTALPITVEITI